MRKRQLFWLVWCLCLFFGAVLAAEAATYPINYTLTTSGKVSINIYDANGKIVRELLHAVPRASGANQEFWDGLDRTGAALPAGSYSWKMLCTPGLAAEFVMNLGGNYTTTGTFGTSDPPGNHNGVVAIAVDATGVYMGAGCAENVCCGAKIALDGTLKWKLPSPTAYQGYIAMASANDVLFTLTSDTRLQKFSPSTGSLIASYTAPSGAKEIDADGTNLAVVTASAVTWLNQSNGTTLDTAPITTPKDLAIASDGTVYVISDTSVVTVTRDNHTPVTLITGLTSPTCLDIDHSTGDILLFEAGTSQRVKRFSSAGTLIATYGTAGGRVDGLYQPTSFFNITDLISDGAGGFYIAEPNYAPRRVTHFNSGGAVMKEWYGGQIWAPLITVEPDDPTVVWMASHWGYWMRLKLNYTTKTWEVHSTYNFANLGNGIIRQGCNDDTWVARVHDGTTYLCRIRFGTPFVVKVDETNWRLLPVAVAESMRSDTPSYIKTWAGSNGAYSWVDQNGDGIPQQAECTFFGGMPESLMSSVDSNMNYILLQNGSRRIATYPVTSWNAVGAPIYGNLPNGQQIGTYPTRFGGSSAWPGFCYHDVTNNEYYAAANSYSSAWGFARDAFMIKWNASGAEVWEAGEGCGNNYGSPRGKVGAFRSFPGGTHGCVIAMDYNGGWGNANVPVSYVWDRDGLYVGGIFDSVNLNGHLFGDYWLNGDNLTGDIYTDPTTGAVTYFGCGENQGYVFNITGWDNWQRANGALTITTPSTANTGQGLYAEYFDNADLTSLVTTRVDSTVDFTWGTALPGGTGITAPTTYSTRWTGVLTPKYGPSYSATGVVGGYFLYPNLPYQGTLHSNALQFGVADGAYCEVKFRGPSIQWYTRMLPDGGTADVYIDGVFQQTVTCQNATEQYQFLRYSNTSLTDADHTLRIVGHGKVYWDYFAQAVGNIDDTGEIYTFYVNSKDGVRLWVNNQLVINNWGDKFVPGEVSGKVKLLAQPTNVRMDYYNGTGSSTVTLSWSSPNQVKEVIPTSCLYPTRDYFSMPRDINSTLPGTIECENYDSGGEGISYHDLTSDNVCYLYEYGGNDRIYRAREGVDIQPLKFDSMPSAQFGLNDSYMVEGAAGEWMKYTVQVAQTGRYTLSALVTTGDVDTTWRGVISGGRFHVEVDDINVTGTLTVPPCTHSQPFATLTTTGVELTAGTHEVKLVFEANSTGEGKYTGQFASLQFAYTGSFTPPSVSLTAPAYNNTYSRPATITLDATATSSDGTISKVAFYAGSTKLNEDTSSPYSYTWSNVSQGTYMLRAVATDNDGDVATSSAVLVHVNSMAKIPIVSPMVTVPNWQAGMDAASGAYKAFDGNTDSWPDMLPFTGCQFVIDLGAGNAKQITLIRTYPRNDLPNRINGMVYAGSNDGTTWTTLASITSDSTVHWFENTVTNGTAFRYLRVTFGANSAANAAEIEFYTTNTPPTVSLTAPADGATFTAPATVSVTATASDSDGIGKVEFYAGNQKLCEDTTAPYSYTWSPVAAGNYAVSAIAYDIYGVRTNSSVANITVSGNAKLNIGSPLITVPNWQSGMDGPSGASKAFDGNTGTWPDMYPFSGCQFVIDLGVDNAKQITLIRTYPRNDLPDRIHGMVYAGSNDGTTWTTLASITSDHTVHWYENTVTNGTAFRYLRVTFGANSAANAAEIEFYTPAGGQVSMPYFTPVAGTYNGHRLVSLATTTTGATIRYTTDGSTPSQSNGTVYSTPVDITTSSTLKAIAYSDWMTDSTVASGAYVINPLEKITVTSGMLSVPNYVAGWGTAASAITAFNGSTSDYTEILPWDYCQFQVDLGAGNAKQIPMVRVYPRTSQPNRINGMVFAGSNDATNWTTLTSITSDNTVHWFERFIDNTTAFRYLRVTFGSASGANVAEIEFYTLAD